MYVGKQKAEMKENIVAVKEIRQGELGRERKSKTDTSRMNGKSRHLVLHLKYKAHLKSASLSLQLKV